MKKKTVVCALGGAVVVGALAATAQPERPKCVGVSVVRDERMDRYTVFRAFEDGTVEFESVSFVPDPWPPSSVRPRWMRKSQ